jgi:GNAT superfamily N-acetyltransferase
MIKFISAKDVLPLRNQVLREGKLQDHECALPLDEEPESFHLGYFVADELVSIATFHIVPKESFMGLGYQLRGMATHATFRGKGYGNMLINFAIVYLRGKKANYLWCNARKVAYKFYEGLGFEFISDEFEIAGIGPHKCMYLKIQ